MDIKLSTSCLDDLFTTQQQRDDKQLAKIREIPLVEIDPFPGHPFKVLDNEEMERLTESIKEQGVITPATVRQKPDGRYELISGHRRKRACELAELKTLRCEVVEIDEDEAIVMMVDSNNYRERILPSEKAFAYKMKLEALKRSAGRLKKNVVPVGQYSRTAVAAETGESETQIQRYIRLTYLIPPLLEQTDAGRIKLRTAVDLSYLSEKVQELVDIHMLVPDHTTASIVRALNALERRLGSKFSSVFRTITVDNGSEFADCEGMENSHLHRGKRRTKLYYCHPHTPNERGSNENMNRMLRRFFPKGTNFDEITVDEVEAATEWLNNYPRKILGWRSAQEVFYDELAKIS